MSGMDAPTDGHRDGHLVRITYDGATHIGAVAIDGVDVPNVIQVQVLIVAGRAAVLFEIGGVDIEIEAATVPGESLRIIQ